MSEPANRLPIGLRTIALFEAAKGLLALAAVCGLLSLRHTDPHAVTDAFLLRHGVDPERHYTRLFIESVTRATNHHTGQIAVLGLAYALIRLAEGYGLWWGKHWAEWSTYPPAGLYLPFRGNVSKVAPLPDSQSRWGNPDLKIYATEIIITDKLPDIKPGLSARAEVLITNLVDVVSVPIQAVSTRKGKHAVFLANAPQEPVPVTVGQYNTKFIQICSGVRDGDQVLLAPPSDTKEKDLGGAIIADDEALPPGVTNQIARAKAPGIDQGAKDRGRPGSDKMRPIPVLADDSRSSQTARPGWQG